MPERYPDYSDTQATWKEWKHKRYNCNQNKTPCAFYPIRQGEIGLEPLPVDRKYRPGYHEPLWTADLFLSGVEMFTVGNLQGCTIGLAVFPSHLHDVHSAWSQQKKKPEIENLKKPPPLR